MAFFGSTVLIQWATATATDWVEYTFTSLADIRAMPKKSRPSDNPLIDDQPGWIAALNVQGVVLDSDAIGFNLDGEGRLVVGSWNEDADDWPFLNRDGWGTLYTFDSNQPDPTLPVQVIQEQEYWRLIQTGELFSTEQDAWDWVAASSAYAQTTEGIWCAVNTAQTSVRYANTATLEAALALDPVTFAWAQEWLDDPNRQPWSTWPKFNKNTTIYGVWIGDEQDNAAWQKIVAARALRGWEVWNG